MKGTKAGFTLALLLAGGITPLAAQVGVFLGGGATVPSSDFGDYAKTGWMATGGVALSFPNLPVQVRGDLLYGRNTHDDTSGDRTDLIGGIANVTYAFPAGNLQPYVVAGVGVLNHHYAPGGGGASESEWKPVFGGGAGINVALQTVKLFIEGRYLKRSDTAFIPILVGIRFGG